MITIMIGDVREQLRKLESDSIHCVVTSPPYWGLRDYGVDGQIGLESSPAEFISVMVDVFEEVRRVLRADGTCWINMGDSYATGAGKVGNHPGGGQQGEAWRGARGGHEGKYQYSVGARGTGALTQPNRMPQPGLKPKDLCMMPHRLAIALQDAGWWVRQDIVWSKPNPMPESVTDRCTKAHEYIFLLTKSARYYYDADAIRDECVKGACGSEFHTGKTGEHQLGRASTKPRGVGFGHGTDAADRGRGRVGKGNAKTFRGGGVYTQGQAFNNAVEGERESHGNMPNESGLRNKRSVWTMATHSFSEAHFATFPPELPETCIKAGTSEKGCCPTCGAQWVRMTESAFTSHDGKTGTKYDKESTAGRLARLRQAAREQGREYTGAKATLGWKKACDCQELKPVPSKVIDPFFGAGTTGLVADRLQRDCIGIELNKDYAEMARKRIQGDSTMFADVRVIQQAEAA